MAGLAPEGSQFDARQYEAKLNEILASDGQDFFTEYNEVYEGFDDMRLLENLLRGIYAYGFGQPSAIQLTPFILQQLDYSLVQCLGLACSYKASKESLNRLLFHPTGCIQKNTKANARKQTKSISLSGRYQVFHKKNHYLDKVKEKLSLIVSQQH